MGDVVVDNSRLISIERKVGNLDTKVDAVGNMVRSMEKSVDQVNNELAQLRAQFQVMMDTQKKEAALQKATTELVRVRQEIASEFENYKIVRDTMLGVLQATDAALVKQTTISRVSEELMLSTPKYWLAPCLVAVAAWIGNDRDLAERAIAEAMRRDEEKTAITMALICRRNKRTDTCYEWLAIYFENQDPTSFNEGDFAYIDAYVNGVFGPDEKHVCDGYIQKWMNEIRSSDASYEERQAETWKNYCIQFTGNCDGLYPDLKAVSPDFDKVNDYISRINAIEPIQYKFSQIADVPIDQESLKRDIDRNLIQLISKYDEDEMALRNDEKYFLAVKKFAGDEEAARKYFMDSMSENRNKVRNFIEQMYEVVRKEEGVTASQKKTAVRFISRDINSGFSRYVKENKSTFPTKISLQMNGFTAETTDSSNKEAVLRDYTSFLENEKQKKVQKAAETKQPQVYMIMAAIAAVLGLVMLFVVPFIGIVAIVGAFYLCFLSIKSKKSIKTNVEGIEADYQRQLGEGRQTLNNAMDQWVMAKKRAEEYDVENLKAVS